MAKVRLTVWGWSVTRAVFVRPPESVDGQDELEIRRVLVVGGGERAARHAHEVLKRMGVTVGRAVIENQRPGERRGGHGPVLRVGAAIPRSRSRCPPSMCGPAEGALIVAVGGVLPTVMTSGPLRLEAPRLSVTRSRAVRLPALR